MTTLSQALWKEGHHNLGACRVYLRPLPLSLLLWLLFRHALLGRPQMTRCIVAGLCLELGDLGVSSDEMVGVSCARVGLRVSSATGLGVSVAGGGVASSTAGPRDPSTKGPGPEDRQKCSSCKSLSSSFSMVTQRFPHGWSSPWLGLKKAGSFAPCKKGKPTPSWDPLLSSWFSTLSWDLWLSSWFSSPSLAPFFSSLCWGFPIASWDPFWSSPIPSLDRFISSGVPSNSFEFLLSSRLASSFVSSEGACCWKKRY